MIAAERRALEKEAIVLGGDLTPQPTLAQAQEKRECARY
jgi:hypothetical protein